MYVLHAAQDPAEQRVLTVQFRPALLHDIELRGSRIVTVRQAGHADHPLLVPYPLPEHLSFERWQIVLFPARLHEEGFDPVEFESVIETLFNQLHYPRDGLGSHIGVEFYKDCPSLFESHAKNLPGGYFNRCRIRIGHLQGVSLLRRGGQANRTQHGRDRDQRPPVQYLLRLHLLPSRTEKKGPLIVGCPRLITP